MLMKKDSILKHLRFIILAVMILNLTACSFFSAKKEVLSPDQLKTHFLEQQAALDTIDTWKIKGRVAVSTENDSGTVSINWDHTPTDFFLQLIAPFGRGTLNIEPHPQGVKMIDHKGKEHVAANERGLIWLKTGWDIPIQRMKKWLLGVIEDKDNPTVRVNTNGQITMFESNKWNVVYSSYQKVKRQGKVISLPKKMTITSKGLKIKMIVSKWNLSE